MSLEVGGRADKYGNEYENQYLVRLLLKLIQGTLKSIIVEPLGQNRDSVEYIAVDKNNYILHYQCKASNSVYQYWRLSDLESHNVFKRSKDIIQQSPNNKYYFISPLTYGELPELCKRARTTLTADEFLNCQLNSTAIKTLFEKCSEKYNIDINNNVGCGELINILSKSFFETIQNTTENISDLNEHVAMYFIGDENAARCLLETYINSNGRYGVEITANEIVAFMEQSGFYVRNNLHNDNILVRINELNKMFYDVFQPINKTLIQRPESEHILKRIESGESAILHGKAGTGKSGCVQNVIDSLSEKGILFLALKLDKHIPNISADNYGKELGLNQSPIYCLHNLSAGKNCVLILDQLDSLRWTNHHSACALDVCKEFISQANKLNKHDNGRISILFISRTFDLENDAGLCSLFCENDKDVIAWSKIKIDSFSKEDVKKIIGPEFPTFPNKLQEILLTPSSLYIWTLLDKDSSTCSISTTTALMKLWWKQIQNHCLSAGLDVERVNTVKDQIVKKMEARSVQTLPEEVFSDYGIELDALISNGLLIKNNEKLSFTHQSFLDYFAISDMLSEIYDGKCVLEVIGSPDTQTPNIRYRILRILQNILDNDEDFFIKVSEDILNSDDVRHYFKCTIFEIIGQCKNPTQALFDYTYEYYIHNLWHDYVCNTVYFGHSVFIFDLDKRDSFNWASEKGLILLRSINQNNQEFVLSKIKPICFNGRENDIKVYNTLCHNPSDDTPNMLKLRLKLLKSNPDLLENFWGISFLIDKDSNNLIPILKLILELCEHIKKHIYFGDDEKITTYSKKHYIELIEELLPLICEKTKEFTPQWPNYEFRTEYRNWTENSYTHHPSRDIVELLKISMSEFAMKEPIKFVKFISEYDNKNSVVYYELCSSAIKNLDAAYSDYAISWLYSDPQNHFFIYTSNQSDYLADSKKIIEKFSATCSETEFKQLEKIILGWKEPTKRMVNTYKRRIEVNNTKESRPVYYAYWGHFQKELLPFLDKKRLSQQSQELINVLNRNTWINTPYYTCGFSVGTAKSVISPIYDKEKHISDKKWLQIISTSNEKMKNSFIVKEPSGHYIEANHFSFSSSLHTQAKLEPVRFAKLSLKFPDDCYSGYITNIISSMYHQDKISEKIDFALICNVVNHYKNHTDRNVIIELLRLIAEYPQEEWPEDILDFVCNVASNHSQIPDEQYVVKSSNDPENITPDSLWTNAINCIRGCALQTIGALLWKHSELSKKFKDVIEIVCDDKNDCVRFSCMFCVLPYFNIDKDFSIRTFKRLIQNDIRTLGFYASWDIICRDFSDNGKFYVYHLLKACDSQIKELEEIASRLLCAIGIYFDDKLLNELYQRNLNENQVNSVCNQAAHSFNESQYHQISKKVLSHYINRTTYPINSLDRLFYDRRFDINRDESFLIKLMSSNQMSHYLHTFLDFINSQEKDIAKYVYILKSICEKFLITNSDWDLQLSLDNLVKCIIKLFDKNRYNPIIKKLCLDMWDDLYRNNLSCIKPFTEIFDNMN